MVLQELLAPGGAFVEDDQFHHLLTQEADVRRCPHQSPVFREDALL